MDLPQNRVHWQELVNTVFRFQIPRKAKYFSRLSDCQFLKEDCTVE
jgi:hypothetical protein